MPTYEYRCNACKREFEVQQRMVDDDLVHCDVCGKDALEKLISPTAFQFKGGGWYKDLYSSAKPDSGGSSDKSSTTTTSSDSSASTSSSSDSSSSSSSSTPAASSGSGSSGSSGSTTSAAT